MRTHHQQHSTTQEIADLVASTLARTTGRGAADAHAVVDREAVVVFVDGVLTPAERLLPPQKRCARAALVRDVFHGTASAELASAVEGTIGRRVAGCTTAIQADPDVVVAVFRLEDEELAA